MAYHMTNLGSASHAVRPYADLDGQVPESGDRAEDFRYADDAFGDEGDPDGELWMEWVARAVEATREAEAEIARWRAASEST